MSLGPLFTLLGGCADSFSLYRSDAFWDKWEPARSIYRHLFDEEPECPWGRMNRPFEFVLGILNGSGCLLGIRAMGEAIDI